MIDSWRIQFLLVTHTTLMAEHSVTTMRRVSGFSGFKDNAGFCKDKANLMYFDVTTSVDDIKEL